MQGAARFLKALKDAPDAEGGTLLDSTITLIGSAMGDAAAHRRRNYPALRGGRRAEASAAPFLRD